MKKEKEKKGSVTRCTLREGLFSPCVHVSVVGLCVYARARARTRVCGSSHCMNEIVALIGCLPRKMLRAQVGR